MKRPEFNSDQITELQRRVLWEQSDQILASWWCLLNRWQWPLALPDPEPPEAYNGQYGNPTSRWAIQCWINEAIGQRAISREWNKDMPGDVFKDFWEYRSGNATAGSLYKQWAQKQVELM